MDVYSSPVSEIAKQFCVVRVVASALSGVAPRVSAGSLIG